jgi:hypothetical protein
MFRPTCPALLPALALASLLTGCASAPATESAAASLLSVEGTIASIDTGPWAYDGNAVVALDTIGRGRVAVQLPARWNLCQAAPVDVEALAVGMRVRATGQATQGDELVVCGDAAHGLVPLK